MENNDFYGGGLLNSIFSSVAQLKDVNKGLYHLISHTRSSTSSTIKNNRSLMFVCDEVARCLELFPWRQMDKTDELWEYLSVVFRHRTEVDMPLITVFMILEEYWLAEKAGGRVSAFRVCHTWRFYFSRLHTVLAFYSG